jgi:hypothetical protein
MIWLFGEERPPRYTSSVHSATSGDEARRIAVSVEWLPELLGKADQD